jgi:hypothetical protein
MANPTGAQVDTELRETQTRIRFLSDPLRKLSNQYRRDPDRARFADDLASAAQLAAFGRLAMSPTLSSMDEYMFMVATIRDAAGRHGLVESLEREEPPAPAGTTEPDSAIPVPDVTPELAFGVTPVPKPERSKK